MSDSPYLESSLKPTIHFMTWSALIPFVVLTILVWFPLNSVEFDALTALRLYCAVVVSFIAGSVWSAALLIQLGKETFEFNRKALMLGAGLVAIASCLVIFIEPQAGVFIAALLYLVLWQIELKTNLARIYPQWFWTLRTKQTMLTVLCLMGVWMTLG